MSECNHTFRVEERHARIDCCIHCGVLEPVVTIKRLEQQLAELKCDMVKRERYHKEQLAELREALEWIQGATDTGTNACKCGRPTGVAAIHSRASRALLPEEEK